MRGMLQIFPKIHDRVCFVDVVLEGVKTMLDVILQKSLETMEIGIYALLP